MMTNGSEKPYYLYLHVPFCRSVCGYCDFCHTVYREEAADRWLAAVAKEITEKKIRKDLLTVYIGGGTPTALNDGQLLAYGADVMTQEPPTADNPLLKCQNAYLTPHIAWATYEARQRLMLIATSNLQAFIEGKPVNVVN